MTAAVILPPLAGETVTLATSLVAVMANAAGKFTNVILHRRWQKLLFAFEQVAGVLRYLQNRINSTAQEPYKQHKDDVDMWWAIVNVALTSAEKNVRDTEKFSFSVMLVALRVVLSMLLGRNEAEGALAHDGALKFFSIDTTFFIQSICAVLPTTTQSQLGLRQARWLSFLKAQVFGAAWGVSALPAELVADAQFDEVDDVFLTVIDHSPAKRGTTAEMDAATVNMLSHRASAAMTDDDLHVLYGSAREVQLGAPPSVSAAATDAATAAQ